MNQIGYGRPRWASMLQKTRRLAMAGPDAKGSDRWHAYRTRARAVGQEPWLSTWTGPEPDQTFVWTSIHQVPTTIALALARVEQLEMASC